MIFDLCLHVLFDFICAFISLSAFIINDTQIVPCNVRLGFNEITGDTVRFEVDKGGPYTFQVHKRSTQTKMGGEDWRHFITDNYLSNSDLICFSFKEQRPRLVQIPIHREDEVVEEQMENAIYARSIILNDDEEDNFYDALHPCQNIIGVPFMTHLTRTNLEGLVMVCFLRGWLVCSYLYVT